MDETPYIPDENVISTSPETDEKRGWFVFALFLIVILGALVILFSMVRPPKTFPTPYFLRVKEGETLFSITLEAERVGLVRSARVLQLITILEGGERTIRAGDYYFDTPISAFELARRLSGGDFHITPVRVTIPEGYTVKDMAKTIARALPKVNTAEFEALAKNDEGKLFPDTYFLSPAVTAEEVYQQFRQNFETKIATLQEKIKDSGRSEKQILIMASIIEREASGKGDRAIISGILWKRYDKGMLLQVDAPFYYILGKTSAEISKADLKLDSPYNTYLHTGLTPTPIGSPGMASLLSAIEPEETPYLFYLHDKDGVAHYAKTFAEHAKNIRTYLH